MPDELSQRSAWLFGLQLHGHGGWARGLAVASLEAAISGMWRLGLPLPPRVRQQALVTWGDLSCWVLPGGPWPGNGSAGGFVHRMLRVLSASTAVGVTPAQPGISIPNISRLWHS